MRILAALLLCLAWPAQAAELVRVLKIEFEGNRVTQEITLRREMVIAEGDPADPVLMEESRQRIQNLGLFKSVTMRETRERGGVRLVYVLREKTYLLPLPRLEVNSDGDYSYGLQLRWANFMGLNHSWRAVWERRQPADEALGEGTRYSLAYSAPFLFDSPNNLTAAASFIQQPVETEDGLFYEESFQSAAFLLTRQLSPEAGSQGWTAGGGISWLNQNTEGFAAPARYGMSTALTAVASYRDIRFKVFSEEGQSFGARLEVSTEDLLADYDYVRYQLNYSRLLPWGERPHQNFHLLAELGVQHGLVQGVRTFSVGGASRLRGYEPDFRTGNAFYTLTAEFLRPAPAEYWQREFPAAPDKYKWAFLTYAIRRPK